MIAVQMLVLLYLILTSAFGDANLENFFKKSQINFVDIEIKLGNIRGIKMKSRKGNDIFAFRGIKYAEPPVLENRFRPPIPITKPWSGIYDATKDGWMCPQPPILLDESKMDEDCLILNVYSNDLSASKSVLVFIHGGAFIFGGSHSTFVSGPQYLLDQNIVLVTINYRLGPLGFLSTKDANAPGNLAFKDQVLALKWIQTNIMYFGGDPNSVTIFGESARSMSVSLHLVSPLSKGLFHGAIMMSGSITGQYVSESSFWTLMLASNLNCPVNDSSELVNCLRKVSYSDIIEYGANILAEQQFLPWMYEIEGDYGQEQFLSDHPTILLANGKINKVPLIIGMTKDEFAPLASVLQSELTENFGIVGPKYFMYGHKKENSSAISNILENFYLKERSIENFEALFIDGVVGFGVHRLVNLARFYTNVYYYRLDFQGRFSYIRDSYGKSSGVYHADDLQYIFVYDGIAPIFNETDRENIMVERLTHWFATFAATGNPNSNPNQWTEGCEWPISDSSKISALYIDEKCHIGDEPYQERYKLWDKLFPIPN